MRKTLLITSLCGALMMSPVALAETKNDDKYASNKPVAVGIGTGVVVGSIVAGPAGAAVAGIIGAMLGYDSYQIEQKKATDLALHNSQQALSEQQQELLAMQRAIESMQQEARTLQVSYTQQPEEHFLAVESRVQFATGSHVIAPEFQAQLDLVAKALKRHEQLQARLTGYADHRGDSNFNQALSMQRALSVKQYLINHGVDSKQLQTIALGEQESQQADAQQAFFDRKVVIQIADGNSQLTAQR